MGAAVLGTSALQAFLAPSVPSAPSAPVPGLRGARSQGASGSAGAVTVGLATAAVALARRRQVARSAEEMKRAIEQLFGGYFLG